MAHTYNRKYFIDLEYVCHPVTAGANLALATYLAADGTVAEIVTGVSASADAATMLPLGSLVTIASVASGTFLRASYIVSANAGASITLTEQKIS